MTELAKERGATPERTLVEQLREEISDASRPAAVERARRQGRLTARERLAHLCDPGSFNEYGSFAYADEHTTLGEGPADGLITGTALLDGRPVALAISDFTVVGGSDGDLGIQKLARVGELALRRGLPLVMLLEGGGHRIIEGLDSRNYGRGGPEFFDYAGRLSGWAPIVCSIMGPGFAGPANYGALADFVALVEGRSTMGIAGPALVKAAIGEDLPTEELGGARFHVEQTGMADIACVDDETAIEELKRFLSFLPTNASLAPPRRPERDDIDEPVHELRSIIPSNRRRAYDVKKVVDLIVDDGDYLELRPSWAQNVVTALARIDGRSVGIMANQPMHLAGTLDANAADKLARFVMLCSAFDLPLVSLCDTPGFMVGRASELSGMVRRSGKVIYALANSQVPLISVVLRKGYGLGWNAMGGGRIFGSDMTLVWPTAEILAMSVEGAVDVALRQQWEDEVDPAAARQALIDEIITSGGAERAAAAFTVDELIDPSETRRRIAMCLRSHVGSNVLQLPPKRHGIIPL